MKVLRITAQGILLFKKDLDNFVMKYFSNPGILLDAIEKYRRMVNIPKGEYCLSDLLK